MKKRGRKKRAFQSDRLSWSKVFSRDNIKLYTYLKPIYTYIINEWDKNFQYLKEIR